jgi:hypothetical protein
MIDPCIALGSDATTRRLPTGRTNMNLHETRHPQDGAYARRLNLIGPKRRPTSSVTDATDGTAPIEATKVSFAYDPYAEAGTAEVLKATKVSFAYDPYAIRGSEEFADRAVCPCTDLVVA